MAARKRNNTAAGKVAAAAAAAAAEQTVVSLFGGDPDENDGVTNTAEDEILEDLQKIDEDHGGGITWELYCESPYDRKGQIAKLTRDELGGLRDHCLALGPGHYYVVARGPGGLFVPNTRRKIKISGLAKAPPGGGTPASGNQPSLTEIMLQLEQRQAQQRQAAKAERMENIKFWAPLLAPIGLELAKNLFGRSGGDNIKDLVGALVGMKDLVGGGGDKTVDTLLKGIELARDMQPENSTGKTWPDALINGVTSLAKEFRPLAESMAAKKNGQSAPPASTPQLQFAPSQQQQTAITAAAPAGQTSSPTPAAEEEGMWRLIEPLCRKLAGELEEFAVNGADPGLAAESLLAKIPRLYRGQMSPEQTKSWLTDARWWDVLRTFQPSIAPYQAYCDDVRQALLQIVEEEQNPAETDDSPEAT